jgi:hypothetical protein
MESVVDIWIMGQVFPQFLGFTLSISSYRGCPHSYSIWGMNDMPFGGRSSETLSHPSVMNNNDDVLIAKYCLP